ncbi:hypothetical protein FTO70_08915 [Methanosarcina sp. KYL-1]|uniref:hypothetical protein n=1 Tax=Methanosarcina sp. KYL-1 TaxID=2602068 RepID=UPI00210101E4|nr:hypothetical protein [Methanosarcina sp. KYL-1]MCQ1535794.1 hypothetical protein [Methanosarcina sp. KYL-1]
MPHFHAKKAQEEAFQTLPYIPGQVWFIEVYWVIALHFEAKIPHIKPDEYKPYERKFKDSGHERILTKPGKEKSRT